MPYKAFNIYSHFYQPRQHRRYPIVAICIQDLPLGNLNCPIFVYWLDRMTSLFLDGLIVGSWQHVE